ncbi:alpha/beta hydrolase [Flavobacterium pallidum]|uniref:Alpha/beta hydrolase n=1 Tax=Flavobacterium pallidum TaxID=2172098 RepID=A0A2S1SJT6_9FLAO|nr:alpha/beta hydrolase [Flavobacterium pallidum]AWI26629.1 alpha/beta hydrolase [Flavobacterium pallidum]
MKKIISILFLIVAQVVSAQQLYTKTFGSEKAKPILFLHGGPGYNSANFEASTAQKLADEGYFVIVYDRRGEGRSTDEHAKFTFEETFKDIDGLLEQFKIQKVTLMGHSFGGVVATLYAEKHPEKINAVILVGAPIALQESFANIIERCRKIYTDKEDKSSLGYMDMLEKMDKSSLEFSSYCFMYAMQNGFYKPKNISSEAQKIYDDLKKTPEYKYATQMTPQGPKGFWKNENYTSLDLSANISALSKKMKVIGLYGKDDSLYSESQIEKLKAIIGKSNVFYIDNSSHNVFIDRQDEFLKIVKSQI